MLNIILVILSSFISSAEVVINTDQHYNFNSKKYAPSIKLLTKEKFIIPLVSSIGLEPYSNSGGGFYYSWNGYFGTNIKLSKFYISPAYSIRYSLGESYLGHNLLVSISYKLAD